MANKAWVKDFHVEQELKNNGIEIGIWEGGKQFGDVYVAKTGVTWCEGKTHRENGVRFTFNELNLLAKHKAVVLKAARKADKKGA
ncbi:MAG: hypothetical protein V3V15_06805 [Sphingorhabdus sp.]